MSREEVAVAAAATAAGADAAGPGPTKVHQPQQQGKTWPQRRNGRSWRFTAAVLVLALHVLVIAVVAGYRAGLLAERPAAPLPSIVYFEVAERPAQPKQAQSPPPPPPQAREPEPAKPAPEPPRKPSAAPATQAAPPPPTAEEWAFAAKYTLKNSKGYRHAWGRQVRSMMGTAVEGPDQGMVRFQIEIAPDGSMVRVDTLWSTSDVAERLARQAIKSMPPLPPTPNGKPLIFEKTIAFTPFAGDDAPTYKNDCRPDPPTFRNRFAWDGRSPQVLAALEKPQDKLDPQALEDCLKQLPQDTTEAEAAHDQRLLERWRSNKLGR